MIKKLLLSCALAAPLILSTPAHADWIMLNNGDRISGTIMTEDTANITINTDTLGQVTLNRANVASMHKGAAPRVLARELRTGQSMSVLPASPPAAQLAQAKQEAQKAVETAAKAKEEPKAGVYKWSGRASAGGTLQDGNSSSKTVVADIDIKARDKMNRFGLGGEANWAQDNGEKTDNDQQLYANYDRFIDEDQKWFIGGRQSLEKDEFEQLDIRSKTGLFVGHQFYERDDLNLQVKAGPEYIYEKLENGDSESDIALGWALDYDQKLADNKVQIFHKHELSTPFADTGAFLFESETGARVPVGEHLNASAQVDFDWDNDPALGVQESDTTYAVKLGYGW